MVLPAGIRQLAGLAVCPASGLVVESGFGPDVSICQSANQRERAAKGDCQSGECAWPRDAVSAAILVASLLAASGGEGKLIWGSPQEWVLTDAVGKELQRFRDFGGLVADQVSVSRDGRRFALRARGTSRIAAWAQGEEPRVLFDAGGFVDSPAITPDGVWVYFSHNPDGPMGGHGQGAWAQLWRLPWQGGKPEAVTNAPGCHVGAAAGPDSSLFYLHANCRGRFDVSRITLEAAPREEQLSPLEAGLEEVVPFAGGFFVVRTTGTGREIWQHGRGKPVLWHSSPSDGVDRKPHVAPGGMGLLFQEAGQLMLKKSPGSPTSRLLSFYWVAP